MKFIYLQFIFIFFISCGHKEIIDFYRPVDTLPGWFKTDENFALRDGEGSYEVHPFFDSRHHLEEKSGEVNFILTTPEGSEFNYLFDLVSGKLVVDKKYCAQSDVWNRSKDDIQYPPYSIGIIPRWLDAMGMPQEVFVFGRGEVYRLESKQFKKTHRARIVGGVNLQYCPKKLCRAEDWISNIIPIAVDPKDSSLSEVNTIEELKKKVDWNAVISFMQNGKGRTLRPRKDLPSYRLLSEISTKSTLTFLENKSYEFTFDKMMKMRNSCHALYRYVWNGVSGLEAPEYQTDEQIILSFQEKFFERNVYSTKEKKADQSKIFTKAEEVSFARWFEKFYQELGKEFKTCSRYTRMGNYMTNKDQFWFFVYFDLFFKMQDVGYVFDCDAGAWIANFRNNNGSWVYSQSEILKQCTPFSLDRAFETAMSYMLDRQNNGLEHYRFIGEDQSLGGSHQKVYSWVNFTGKKLRCNDEDEQKENAEMISRKIFAQPTPWRRFSQKNNGLYDLIY